jgi:hypothetical protein
MIEPFRTEFNARWNEIRYGELLDVLNQRTRAEVGFRVSETPCFFTPQCMDSMSRAGAELTEQLLANSAYLAEAEAAIPEPFRMPGCDAHPHFMTVDFGLVRGADGRLTPKLVEMQAFPSVFGFQAVLAEAYDEVYRLQQLRGLDPYLGGLDRSSYWTLLRETILGRHAAENVVLTEVEPAQQKTLADFNVHEDHLGIRTVDVASLVKEGNRLYYRDGRRLVPIHRIYNRAIVDEIVRKNVVLPFDYRDELDVEWAGHPDWYFKISKFAIPFLQHESVPPAVFLDEFLDGRGREKLPADRERWVFKPLYSFAGKGVQFAPTDADLAAIPPGERRNYLLQERMQFEPVIRTPEGMTQAEIRILYAWPDGGALTPMISLVRMGRGLMMGVDHNRDKTWVGASAAFVAVP